MQWTQECEISTAWCQLQCTPSTTMAIKHETYSSCRSHDKTEIVDTASVMYELVFVCYTRRVRHPPPIPLLPAPSLEHTLSVDLLTEDILLLHHYSSPSSITCVPGHLAPKLLMIFHHWRKRKVKKKKKKSPTGWLQLQRFSTWWIVVFMLLHLRMPILCPCILHNKHLVYEAATSTSTFLPVQ